MPSLLSAGAGTTHAAWLCVARAARARSGSKAWQLCRCETRPTHRNSDRQPTKLAPETQTSQHPAVARRAVTGEDRCCLGFLSACCKPSAPSRRLRFALLALRGRRAAPEMALCVAETIVGARSSTGDGTESDAHPPAATATGLPGHGKRGTLASPASILQIRVRIRSSFQADEQSPPRHSRARSAVRSDPPLTGLGENQESHAPQIDRFPATPCDRSGAAGGQSSRPP